MQLADHPGECSLATLIRTRYDQDAFGTAQRKIVGDDRRLFTNELVSQRDVEGVFNADLLACL